MGSAEATSELVTSVQFVTQKVWRGEAECMPQSETSNQLTSIPYF